MGKKIPAKLEDILMRLGDSKQEKKFAILQEELVPLIFGAKGAIKMNDEDLIKLLIYGHEDRDSEDTSTDSDNKRKKKKK